jgi:hypothetical protein
MAGGMPMARPEGSPTQCGFLFHLFFRRFFDNDLVAAGADRHAILAVAWAGLAVPGLWVSILLIPAYNNPFVSPGHRLVMALDHKLQFLAVSMIVGALVATLAWDSLSFDERDAAILGPLPVDPGCLAAAKLAALIAFAALFGTAQNLLPTVFYPIAMVANLPISPIRVAGIAAAHALSCVAAALFGFFGVLVLRETLVLVSGTHVAARLAVAVRAALVLGLTAGLLFTPRLPGGYAERALSQSGSVARLAPPFWFLGVYESLAGSSLFDDDRSRGQRRNEAWRTADDRSARAVLSGFRAALRHLAVRGAVGLMLAVCLGAGLFLANCSKSFARSCRCRSPAARASWLRRLDTFVARVVTRSGSERAGFMLAGAAFSRSPRHRLVLAAGAASGVAATLFLAGTSLLVAPPGSVLSASVLCGQSVLLLAMLVSLRLSVNAAANPCAGWMLHVSWPPGLAAWNSGVRRRVFLSGVVPVVIVILALTATTSSLLIAARHAIIGILAGSVIMLWLFWPSGRTFLVDSSGPGEGVWSALWPVTIPAVAGAVWGLARLEVSSLQSPKAAGLLAGGLAAVLALLVAARSLFCRSRDGLPPADDTDDDATLRLGLDPW